MSHGCIGGHANPFRVRLGAVALAASGILFVLYPAIRPYSDEVSLQGAEAFASPGWVLAHTFAMLAFILLTPGLFGLHISLQGTSAERPAFQALVLSWIGIGLTLPFYGAETFGLNAIGQEAVRQHSSTLLSLANDVRFGSGIGMILVGLVLLAVGAILAAIAVWRSRILPKWGGICFALAFGLYLPQFFTPQPARVAHGLLVAAGCLWIAAGLWRQSRK